MISRSLLKPFIHVWSKDPGVDAKGKALSWAEFFKTGDLRHLPTHEGESLTIFHLQPLSRRQLAEVKTLVDTKRLQEASQLAVLFALVKVDGWIKADGLPLEVTTHQVNGERRCTIDVLDELQDAQLIDELGGIIYERSHLNPTRGQG